MTTPAKYEAALDEIKTICQSVAYHPAPTLSTFADLLEQVQTIAEQVTADDVRAA